MDRETISRYRLEIIESFITIENLMDCVISQHYFGCLKRDFILEVLYDPYSHAGLKTNVVEKIAKLSHDQMEQIRRASNIRNVFAHCKLDLFTAENAPLGLTYYPDPKNPEKALDFGALYEEFCGLRDEIVGFLYETYRGLGGEELDLGALRGEAG